MEVPTIKSEETLSIMRYYAIVSVGYCIKTDIFQYLKFKLWVCSITAIRRYKSVPEYLS